MSIKFPDSLIVRVKLAVYFSDPCLLLNFNFYLYLTSHKICQANVGPPSWDRWHLQFKFFHHRDKGSETCPFSCIDYSCGGDLRWPKHCHKIFVVGTPCPRVLAMRECQNASARFFSNFNWTPCFIWAIWVWGIENQGQKWTINGETNGQNVFFLQLMRMAMGTKKVGAGRDKIQLS